MKTNESKLERAFVKRLNEMEVPHDTPAVSYIAELWKKRYCTLIVVNRPEAQTISIIRKPLNEIWPL